ncbi:MAG: FtsX-like permease family protein [Asgard group archaeon]|nr:FtsX-like permease family protein [Asgard group archaeon]
MSLEVIKFAFQNAFRKKLIAGLSIVGIGIGISLMVVLSASTAGMESMMSDTLLDKAGDVEVKEFNKATPMSQLPDNITDIIQSINSSSKIEVISPEIYANGFQQFSENISLPQVMQIESRGVIVEKDQQLNGGTGTIADGELFDKKYEIIVADIIADNAPDLFEVGKDFEYRVNETFSLTLTTSGIFETEDGPMRFLNPLILMSLETAQAINDYYLPYEQEGYNVVRVRFDSEDIEETKDYAEEIENLTPKMSVSLQGANIESANTVMDTFDTFSLIVSIVSILAGGMAIIVAQLMGVNERMKEFAIMKATGWKNRTIFFDIILESLIVGIIGSLVGFLFGLGLVYMVEYIADRAFVTITWEIVLTAIGFGTGIGLLGGLLPGYYASRIKPMEVIRGL